MFANSNQPICDLNSAGAWLSIFCSAQLHVPRRGDFCVVSSVIFRPPHGTLDEPDTTLFTLRSLPPEFEHMSLVGCHPVFFRRNPTQVSHLFDIDDQYRQVLVAGDLLLFFGTLGIIRVVDVLLFFV